MCERKDRAGLNQIEMSSRILSSLKEQLAKPARSAKQHKEILLYSKRRDKKPCEYINEIKRAVGYPVVNRVYRPPPTRNGNIGNRIVMNFNELPSRIRGKKETVLERLSSIRKECNPNVSISLFQAYHNKCHVAAVPFPIRLQLNVLNKTFDKMNTKPAILSASNRYSKQNRRRRNCSFTQNSRIVNLYNKVAECSDEAKISTEPVTGRVSPEHIRQSIKDMFDPLMKSQESSITRQTKRPRRLSIQRMLPNERKTYTGYEEKDSPRMVKEFVTKLLQRPKNQSFDSNFILELQRRVKIL